MDGAGKTGVRHNSVETEGLMFTGGGGGDTPEAGESRLYREAESCRLGGSLHYVPVTSSEQPLSDIMPDIALAGATAAFSSLSLSRSVPTSSRGSPPLPPSLSPDVVEVAEAGSRWSPRSSIPRGQHSYRHGPSHMFL